MTDTEKFRAETRAWLDENCPAEKRGPMEEGDHCFGGKNPRFKNPAQKLWLERMAAKGWTAPQWPVEYGGGGLSAVEAEILKEEMERIEAHPPLTSLGIWMLGPALLRFGTEEQKRRYLPDIVHGRIWWCQGYSEPNAGSDLVSLQMRAELVGDEFIVNGQKIWTSYGHQADWIFCLVRTDPTKPRHDGVSFLLIDMRSPGVTASPLRLISGGEHFAQEFFDDVHVPKENLVGVLNRGWDVAKYLLLFERQMIGGMRTGEMANLIDFAIEQLGAEAVNAEPMLRARLVDLDMRLTAFQAMAEHYQELAVSGRALGAESSMLKYFATELAVKRHDMRMSILGSQSLDQAGDITESAKDWLAALPNRIGGGTSEIQLNVVAKRVLGLPGA